MLRKPVFFILSFILTTASAQTSVGLPAFKPFQPKENTLRYKLGERVIQVKTFQYGDAKDVVYVNLHDDEMTAINGTKKLLEKKGGLLIKIENYRTRNIKFKLDGKYYTIDPNRMFSRAGIARSLLIFGRTNPKAIDEIEKFANYILQLIPPNPSWIVALHNNTNGRYSINSYIPGGDKQKDAKGVNVNNDLDADDFFLTTDSVLFDRLASQKYNAIWQDNVNAKKDGSLSIYCGERNIQYINCETEHGRQPQYDEMIVAASIQIEEKKSGVAAIKNNPTTIMYDYQIPPTSWHFSPKDSTEIFFGEKKVGMLKTVTTDSSWLTTGKLEMNKDFPLYSNVDFFLFLSFTDSPRLEVRIDPTTLRQLLDPRTANVNISIRTVR